MCLEKWIEEIVELYEKGYYFWKALEIIKKRMEEENDKVICTKESKGAPWRSGR